VTANIDRGRRPWRRETTGVDGFDLAAPAVDLDDRADLHAAIRSLALGQRRVVVLRHLWGLSVEETAAELGIHPGTVKSQTSAALERLRAALAPIDSEGTKA
jgi:DNA-directed RNA polymerase specialized sigma24 family protein